jgi:hypothetical protein
LPRAQKSTIRRGGIRTLVKLCVCLTILERMKAVILEIFAQYAYLERMNKFYFSVMHVIKDIIHIVISLKLSIFHKGIGFVQIVTNKTSYQFFSISKTFTLKNN